MAFATDRRNFRHAAVFEHGHDRARTATREVDVLDGIASSIEKAFEFQRNGIEGLSDPLVFLSWKRGEHFP